MAGQDQTPKETVALDMKYGTKKLDDKKVRLTSYELGGGRTLSPLLQAPLHFRNLSNLASICIVLDLSKPGNCVESLNYWIPAVKEILNSSLKDLQNADVEGFKALRGEVSSYW